MGNVLFVFDNSERPRKVFIPILFYFPTLCFGRRAGHGGYVEDTNGDEADGMDETLVPVDYQKAGQITDDEIFDEVGHHWPQ